MGDTRTTADVMADYVQAFGARDLDAIAECFHEDAFVICGDNVWRGRQEIREFYETNLAESWPTNLQYEGTHRVMERDIFHLVWRGKSPSHEIPVAVDTFVVQEGALHALTVYMGGDS